ncbi:MAG: hypothetical protein V3U33_03445 [candidate division NC10 bacterium]
MSSGGEERWAWTRRNLACVRPGGPARRSEAQVGDGRPAAGQKRMARKLRVSLDRLVECSAGEDPLPEPFRARLAMGRPGARGMRMVAGRLNYA